MNKIDETKIVIKYLQKQAKINKKNSEYYQTKQIENYGDYTKEIEGCVIKANCLREQIKDLKDEIKSIQEWIKWRLPEWTKWTEEERQSILRHKNGCSGTPQWQWQLLEETRLEECKGDK